ncbi:laccase domain-containing protein [Kocuria rhizophila]|nr:laccase domain-containing protein [Kocuria rhizophila]
MTALPPPSAPPGGRVRERGRHTRESSPQTASRWSSWAPARAEPDDVPVLAVAHAGRKGLLDGVLQATVGPARAHGAEQLTARTSELPVCGRCYEVPGEMARSAERILPGITTTTARGTPGLTCPGRPAAARGARRARCGSACRGPAGTVHPRARPAVLVPPDATPGTPRRPRAAAHQEGAA